MAADLDLRNAGRFYQGMTRSADEVVTEFCKKWASPDPEELASYFTEDGVYHNIPMDPVQGPAEIKEFIAGFTAAFDGIDFQVHRQICDGTSGSGLVMNERTDVMRRKGGGEIALPVMGVFEVVDGKSRSGLTTSIRRRSPWRSPRQAAAPRRAACL
ncbi:MAG: hypothetical protein NVSMB60_32740 [Mycobacterium sp.]